MYSPELQNPSQHGTGRLSMNTPNYYYWLSRYRDELYEAVDSGDNRRIALILNKLPEISQKLESHTVGVLLAQNNYEGMAMFLPGRINPSRMLYSFLQYLSEHQNLDQGIALNNVIDYLDVEKQRLNPFDISRLIESMKPTTESINGSLLLYLIEKASSPVRMEDVKDYIMRSSYLPATNQVLRQLKTSMDRLKL